MKVAINRRHCNFTLSKAAYDYMGLEWDGLGTIFNYCDDEKRTDPKLIAAIETLGEEVNSNYSRIGIVEIPDDVEWEIEEDDGYEWVSEKHRTWE